MTYPLIKKWLNLDIRVFYTREKLCYTVSADELERRLAEGREVFFMNKTVALGIGEQPIKKQTQAEAALEFISHLYELECLNTDKLMNEAKKILEMKD